MPQRGAKEEAVLATSDLAAEANRLFGLPLTPAQVEQFARYYQELVEWNERVNLTAITDPEEVKVKHFLDSLSFRLALPAAACSRPFRRTGARRTWKLLDVGSGAGFPGVPLGIACPQLTVTCLDSVGKKTVFLRHIVQTLGLENMTVITGRAEDVAREAVHRERYDFVVSRAVAELRVLAEYCLPFARPGGLFIAAKQTGIEDEIAAAQRAISVLGGKLRERIPIDLPSLEGQRQLLVIEKVKRTPASYPRRAGLPAQRPL